MSQKLIRASGKKTPFEEAKETKFFQTISKKKEGRRKKALNKKTKNKEENNKKRKKKIR